MQLISGERMTLCSSVVGDAPVLILLYQFGLKTDQCGQGQVEHYQAVKYAV